MAADVQEEKAEVEVEETSEVQEEKQKSSSGVGAVIVIGVGLLVMLLTPLASYFVVKSVTPPMVAEKEAENDEATETVLSLDTVRVNVRQTKGTRFLMLECHLVLSESRLAELLQSSTAMLTDKVSLAASRRTVDDLEGPEGRESLKRDIMAEINAAIRSKWSGAVIDVYFSEFLVQ
jgi:flagellar basal body-associated protein FliL